MLQMLLGILLHEASSPAARAFALAELKKLEDAVKSPLLKAVIEAAELVLAAAPAAA